jgi:LPS sulfotransferase NodH
MSTEPLILIIATTPRTGGHFLCELLTETGICGRPSEYILNAAKNVWREMRGFESRAEYIVHYTLTGWSGNGIFGAKLTWNQFCEMTDDFSGRSRLTSIDRALTIERAFGGCRYIFLRRRDKLRQAISYHRALCTGRWSSLKAGKIAGRFDPDAVEAYDHDSLDQLIAAIVKAEGDWLEYFRETGIAHLTIFYEDLAVDKIGVVRGILSHVGIEDDWNGACEGKLHQQSDSKTEEWVRRYRRGLG